MLRWKWCTAVACVLLAGACARNINSTERDQPVAHPDIVQDKRIVTDSSLQNAVGIVGVRQATVGGDLLKVQVDVTNSTSKMRQFNYKFEWFDQSGIIVDTPNTTWKPMHLQGRETAAITGTAPTPAAKDFRLKLQESRH